MMSNELLAIIKTNRGNIKIRLFDELAPITVANFINLVEHKFYKGLFFHRVIKKFMIQTGRPGKDCDNAGYHFADEFNPQLRHHKAGIVAMANKGPDSNSSQFFITHVPTPELDDVHSVFGEVINESSQKTVNAITQNDFIIEIELQGDTKTHLFKNKDHVDKWNKVLDKK
jgi:peptidyl-prolyl cis-trans isomerase B (cyclophilin B)